MARPKVAAAGVALAALVIVGCNAQQDAINRAQDTARTRQIPAMVNDVEYANYIRRLALADNPAVILFCTAFPKNSSVPPVTFPIQGKLTSSGKRPWQTADSIGPDAMYGTSTEYRYGWTPAGTYVDFTGMDTICTTELTIFQRESTTVVNE